MWFIAINLMSVHFSRDSWLWDVYTMVFGDNFDFFIFIRTCDRYDMNRVTVSKDDCSLDE